MINFEPTRVSQSIEEILSPGLRSKPYYLPTARYFYDETGSHLFDKICTTPEYYPTRTEDALLKAHADEIIQTVRPDKIIEFGSGMSKKVYHLLDACAQQSQDCVYWPQDICPEALDEGRRALGRDYPWLTVNPLCGDYLGGLGNVPYTPSCRHLALFLGSTIGNFPAAEASTYLTDVHDLLAAGDFLLLGADRMKPPEVLTAAYDDAAGYTAAFNINALRVLNAGLRANFVVDAFSHRAVFNAEKQRIEMHLVADNAQEVYIETLDMTMPFDAGDTLRTEISRKFDWDSLSQLLLSNGFRPFKHYHPENHYFSLVLAERMAQ